jgi:hypothetical protein
MFEERKYREWIKAYGFIASVVSYKESDLFILARDDVKPDAEGLLLEARKDIEEYIMRDAKYLTALEPHVPNNDAPLIIRRMADSAARFGVGPMAAVAGAISDYVGEQLWLKTGDVIVENGGDIFVRCGRPLIFALYAGETSLFTGKVKFTVRSNGKPVGICTSSATVGHSLSFGKADAVCVISTSAAEADAAATAFCNMIQNTSDIELVIRTAQKYDSIRGVIAAMNDKLGIWGDVELIP